MNIMTHLGTNRTILFEAEAHLKNGFIAAKKYCNSVFLETGKFESYMFNKNNTRTASAKEVSEYTALKNNSPFTVK